MSMPAKLCPDRDALTRKPPTPTQNHAIEFVDARNAALEEKRKALGVEDAVLEVEGVTPAMAVALSEGGVKTLDESWRVRPLMICWLTTETSKEKERVRVPGRARRLRSFLRRRQCHHR